MCMVLGTTDSRETHVHGLGDDGGDSIDLDSVDLGIPQLITPLAGERVRAIAAGSCSSCAVTDSGALYTWGEDCYGNLGHGDRRDRGRPTLVEGLAGIRVVGVSSGFTHTLALAANGSVYAAGAGSPELGLGLRSGADASGATLSPRRVPDLVCMVPLRQ
jgi:alpha-tubulin suppressor-like RCC1 family protein